MRERWDNFVANQLADMNKKNTVELVRIQRSSFLSSATVLPAKSDSDVLFCLQSFQGLKIDRSLVN